VVAVLARLHHLVFVEMLLVVVDRLLGSIVPTGIDPFVALSILPRAIDLGDDGLPRVIRVVNVYPVAFNTC
jgi:hypothetical protein